MPRSSTASLVMEEVIIWPLPISTRTCDVVAPFFTSTTVPLIWLRALMRMMAPTMLCGARQRHGPADRCEIKSRDRRPQNSPALRALRRHYRVLEPNEIALCRGPLLLGIRSGQNLAAGGRQLHQCH